MKFSQCQEIQNMIINEKLKLKDIFELETGSIRSSIICLIALNIVIFIIIILYYPIIEIYLISQTNDFHGYHSKKDKGKNREEHKDEQKCCCCRLFCFIFIKSAIILIIALVIALVILFLLIIIIVIFSVLCEKYNHDDTGKFLDFLECLNVNKEGFYKYSSLQDLPPHFTLVKIFQIFFIFMAFFSVLYTIVEKMIDL